jgi:hypothetical protein
MGGDVDTGASQARQQEMEREIRIAQGTKDIRKQFGDAFGDSYYKKFEDTAKAFYKPQLDQQYTDSLRNLQAALARNGLTDSSVRVDQEARLNRERATGDSQVGENIRNQMNERKSDVANQETIATGQLQTSADTGAAAAQASNLIRANSEFPGWSPLGQVFTDTSAFLANQGEAERSGNPRYNMGVSRWGDNARRYISNIGR